MGNKRNQRRKLLRARFHQPAPRTAGQISDNMRNLIGRTVTDLEQRVTANRHGHTAAEMLAAFGADGPTLAGWLATGKLLARKPITQGTSGQGTSGQ